MIDSNAKKHDSGLLSFSQFLNTGELGRLKLGLSPTEVTSLLGDPNLSSRPFEASDQDRVLNVFYKNLIATFYDDELVVYIINYLKGYKLVRGGLPSELGVNWFSVAKKKTVE